MTRFSLIRHGAHDVVDHILVGRMAGVRLNERGRDQARRIADHLYDQDVDGVQSSPQMRAQETAEPVARRLGLSMQIQPELDELDVGAWTGRSFSVLARDPLWSLWNSARGSARPPNGESMHELQIRAVDHLRKMASEAPSGHFALCSHAEVIRAIILHALEFQLDDFHRVEIAPGTISTLKVGGKRMEVIELNRPVAS